MTQPPINQDIIKYQDSIYRIFNRRLVKIDFIKSTSDYNHFFYELHHWLPRTMRKNNPKKYAELEHLQKLILLDKDFHRSLPNMRDEKVLEKTGLHKRDLMYLKD